MFSMYNQMKHFFPSPSNVFQMAIWKMDREKNQTIQKGRLSFFIIKSVYSALANADAQAAIVYELDVASCCCRCETLAMVPASVSSGDAD